jgi:orotate phosphoribosyltransferase
VSQEPFDQLALARRIHEVAHVSCQLSLRSGAESNSYFDKYTLEADPVLLHQIAQRMVALLPTRIDAIAGLELGGVPLAAVCSHISRLPARFIRKQPKSDGTLALVEGGPVRGLRLAVIEDVISTGGQAVDSCKQLRQLGAQIAGVVCIIDRQAGGAESLARSGVRLHSVFTAADIKRAAEHPADGR